MPVIEPMMNGRPWPLPGSSYFSCSAPKKIIEAFTAKIPVRAAKPDTPVSCAINQIITEEESEYSTQRK